jgi:hypothetical protein
MTSKKNFDEITNAFRVTQSLEKIDAVLDSERLVPARHVRWFNLSRITNRLLTVMSLMETAIAVGAVDGKDFDDLQWRIRNLDEKLKLDGYIENAPMQNLRRRMRGQAPNVLEVSNDFNFADYYVYCFRFVALFDKSILMNLLFKADAYSDYEEIREFLVGRMGFNVESTTARPDNRLFSVPKVLNALHVRLLREMYWLSEFSNALSEFAKVLQPSDRFIVFSTFAHFYHRSSFTFEELQKFFASNVIDGSSIADAFVPIEELNRRWVSPPSTLSYGLYEGPRVAPPDLLPPGRIEPKGQRKVTSGLNDMIRSAFPGGNVGKPLMNALGALLASGVLTRGGAGQAASAGSQLATDTDDASGLLGGLGGLLNKLQQGGWAIRPTPGLVPGKISRFRLVNLVRRLAPTSSKHCLR